MLFPIKSSKVIIYGKILLITAMVCCSIIKTKAQHVNQATITSPVDVTSDQGALIIGSDQTSRLLLDNNEIQGTTDLHINNDNNVNLLLNHGGGKVGIGTQSPTAILSIKNSGDSDGVKLLDFSENEDETFSLQGLFKGTGESGNALKLRSVWNDDLLTIYGNGNVGLGVRLPQAKLEIYHTTTIGGRWAPHNAYLKIGNGVQDMIMDGNEITTNESMYFGTSYNGAFYFRNMDANSMKELVMIDENGNLGIGITSPAQPLHVSSSSKVAIVSQEFTGNNAGVYAAIGNDGQNGYFTSGSGSTDDTDLILQTATAGNETEKMRITNNGLVGIGSSSPSKLLHVRGNPEDDNDSDILAIFENSASSGEDAGIAIKGSRHGSTGTVSFIDLDIYDSNESTTNFTMGRIGAGKSNGAGINGQLRFFTNNNGSLGERMRIKQDGKVGIGTTSPTKMLEVAGTAYAREVKVDISAGADFVFDDNYNLPSLDATSSFIKENHHLPGIASAAEMESQGIELGEMNIRLLQKIEELTLHIINQHKDINELKEKVRLLEEKD